jgi:uncharacterized membrane protein
MRRLRLALLASLAINLALVGLFVGLALRGGPPPAPPPGLAALARALPEPERRDLVRALRRERPAWRDDRAALDSATEALRVALLAEPFEAEALAAALAAQRTARDALTARAEAALVARLAAMTPEARAELAAGPARRGSRAGGEDRRGGEHAYRPREP